MTPDFTPTDHVTWPETLTLGQVAAIYQRSASAVQSAVTRGRFHPAPKDGKPLRWRKRDLMRDLGYERRTA